MKKTNQLFKLLDAKTPLQQKIVLPEIISRLSEFFKVSEQSAMIRLDDLGYSSLEKMKEYYPMSNKGNYNTNYHTPVSKKPPQTLSLNDAFDLYTKDEYLKETLNTGAFVYADGYFVLNDKQYVNTKNDSKYSLTDYAKQHLGECVLSFSSRYISITPSTTVGGMMYRSDTKYEKRYKFDSNTQNADLYNKSKEFERQFSRSLEIGTTANEILWDHMEKQKWNTSIFQDKTLLIPMAYSRVQDKNYVFKMDQIVAMGVGLELTLPEMTNILQLAGYSFRTDDRKQQAYQFLFSSMQGCSIDECNDFLEKVGVKPLGSKSNRSTK